MPRAIIETATGLVSHYPAPEKLPEGGGYKFVELSAEDAAQIGLFNARYSVDLAGRLIVTPVPVVVPAPTSREVLRTEMEAATTLGGIKAALVKWARTGG